MRPLPVRSFRFLRCLSLTWILAVALFATDPLPAQARNLDDLLTAVVRVKTSIEPDGRTVATLGRKREGSGVLIDTEGLVLTIGYLMVEAPLPRSAFRMAARSRPAWWATITRPASACCARSCRPRFLLLSSAALLI